MHRYKVLLISPNKEEREIEAKNLKSRGLNIESTDNLETAKKLLLKDGDIHIVLTEIEVPLTAKNLKETAKGEDIYKAISDERRDVEIYLYTSKIDFSENKNYSLLSGYFYSLLSGYFYKKDNDYDDIVRKVTSELNNSKNRAPFYETLVSYANKAKDSWHTPGHSSGYSIKKSPWVKDFYEFFGQNFFISDVSVSVPMLDSLLHPTGVIKEAQELAARAYGSRYTFFSTNGTSTSNKILLQTLLKPGDSILLDRNCHKSVHYGVIIAGANPIYLTPTVNNKYGIFGPIKKKTIIQEMDKAIKEKKSLKVIILTSCTYDGLIYDIPYIVKEAHKRNIKVIVDEAWFGHANFHKEFYPSAMAAGADYSTQSTHKTMSAFSQGSMIHIKDPDFENIKDFFLENFNMHTSTSPQYPIIASLDIARKQMAMEGHSLLQRSLELSETFRKAVNSLKNFRVLNVNELISPELVSDGIKLDKTKITIDIGDSGFNSQEVEYILLSKHNIQIEKSTFNTISVLITIGSTWSKLNRLYLALEDIDRMSLSRKKKKKIEKQDFNLTISPIKYLPRSAFYCEGEKIPLKKCLNRVSSIMVTPYPPGIPLLVPGQIITNDIIDVLQTYREHDVEIHGLDEGKIKVITKEEEKILSQK